MTIETLASGYGLIEGPRADSDGRLYFSDVTNGGVYCREPGGAILTVVPKRRGVGGIALHTDGGLVISGRNVCHVREGQTRILLEVAGVGGFNDLFTDSAGRVYVGSLRSDPFGEERERTPGELYRIDPGGGSEELYGGVGLTNGIGFSPDGARIYHSDTAAGCILVHDCSPEGKASNRRVFAKVERGAPDGLAVDAEGCVWTASYGGGCALRYTPEGELDLALDVPASAVTSLCFAGPDLKDLIVVTADNSEDRKLGGTVFTTRLDVPGLPAPKARV